METDFDVRDKARISWVLQSIMQAHQLVDVDFGDGHEPSQSIIVDLDLKNGFFYLDEFPAKEANHLATKKCSFDLRGSLEGVGVKARGLKVEAVESDKKGLLYRIPLPAHLVYKQRRDSYRVAVGYGVKIPVDIRFDDGTESATDVRPIDLEAAVYNLSTTGCRLLIPDGSRSFSEEPGQTWHLCFTLPEAETPLKITIETCHSRYIKRTRDWQFGCLYKDIEASALERLGRFITDMQRKERSRQNGLS